MDLKIEIMKADEKRLGASKRTVSKTMESVEIDQGRLTIDELRKCKGFETVSDAEGAEIIESLFQLSLIVYNF